MINSSTQLATIATRQITAELTTHIKELDSDSLPHSAIDAVEHGKPSRPIWLKQSAPTTSQPFSCGLWQAPVYGKPRPPSFYIKSRSKPLGTQILENRRRGCVRVRQTQRSFAYRFAYEQQQQAHTHTHAHTHKNLHILKNRQVPLPVATTRVHVLD